MKGKIVTAIILSLLVTVAGCGQTGNDTDNDIAATQQPENTETLTTTENTALMTEAPSNYYIRFATRRTSGI